MDLLEQLLADALPFGARHVALTGGEPHLHPAFEQMVETITAFGYTWHFVSHGQRSEPYLPVMAKHRDKLTHVSLSVDGADAETHDTLRNRPGAFEKVRASARTYVELGYKVRLSVTLNQQNKTQVEALVQLAREWSAYGINFAGTIPTDWNQELVLSDQQSLELYHQILALREQTKFDLRPVSSLQGRGGVNFCRNLNLHEAAFNARGELIFCCDTIEDGALIGSIKELPLYELVKRWLKQSADLQIQRAERIAKGNLGEKFDTCAFCNAFFN